MSGRTWESAGQGSLHGTDEWEAELGIANRNAGSTSMASCRKRKRPGMCGVWNLREEKCPQGIEIGKTMERVQEQLARLPCPALNRIARG